VEGSPHGLPLPPATLGAAAHGLLDSGLSTGEWNNQSEHHRLAEVTAAHQCTAHLSQLPSLFSCAFIPMKQFGGVLPLQALAEHMQNSTVHADGVGRLQALLGSDEGTPDENSASAEQALQAALAAMPGAPQVTGAAAQLAQHAPGAAALTQQTCSTSAGAETADRGPMGLSSSDEAVQRLTAEIVAGAQRAALDAISSSVQVRAQPPYIIATECSRTAHDW
jgi:hypothetical protein